MAITKLIGPSNALDVVSHAVTHLMSRGPRALSALGGAAPKASQPVKLFVIGLDNIKDEHFLDSAVNVGWRYLVVNDGPVAVADVKVSPSGAAAFSSLIRGDIAVGLSEAADLASKKYGEYTDKYEPRALDIPALYISALWLHGPRDAFFPFLAGGGISRTVVREDPRFVKNVLLAAETKRHPPRADDVSPPRGRQNQP